VYLSANGSVLLSKSRLKKELNSAKFCFFSPLVVSIFQLFWRARQKVVFQLARSKANSALCAFWNELSSFPEAKIRVFRVERDLQRTWAQSWRLVDIRKPLNLRKYFQCRIRLLLLFEDFLLAEKIHQDL